MAEGDGADSENGFGAGCFLIAALFGFRSTEGDEAAEGAFKDAGEAEFMRFLTEEGGSVAFEFCQGVGGEADGV